VSNEVAIPINKSFSSSSSVHKADPSEIGNIPKGCFSLGLPFKHIIILLEFLSNADEGTETTVKSISTSSHVLHIDPSDI